LLPGHMYTYTGVDLGIAMYACSSCGCLGYNPSQDYYYVVHSNSIGFDQYRLGINTPPWSNSSTSTTSNPYPTNNNEGMGNENEPWDGADNNPYIDPEYNGGQVAYDPNQTLNQNDPCDINIKLDGVQPISTFSNGCIIAFASAGNYGGTYTFTISGSNTSIVIGSGSVAFFKDLSPGTYTITVQKNSGDGCLVTSKSFTLFTGNNQDHPYTKTIINNWPCRTCSYAVTFHTDGRKPDVNDPNNCRTNNCSPVASNIPCPGDPIRNPTISPYGKDIKAGRNGFTRRGGNQIHDGLDIYAEVNTPIYPIYDGTVVANFANHPPTFYKRYSYGNFIIIKSTLPNGQIVYISYNHLNTVNYNNGDSVKLDDLIGLSGRTGNANQEDKNIKPHIHIQVRPTFDFNQGSWKHYKNNLISIDPEQHLRTKFDENGTPINPC